MKKKYEIIFGIIFCLLVFVFFYYTMIGFHNVDLSYNILKLSYDNDENYYYDYIDCNLFKCYSYAELYTSGMTLILYSSAGFVALIIVSGAYMLNRHQEKK